MVKERSNRKHTMELVYRNEAARSVFTVKEMPADEQPREKMMHLGPSYLSDAELLAILFRSGTREHNAVDLGRNVLQQHGGLHAMKRRNWSDFRQVPGVGTVRALVLDAALELARRVAKPEPLPGRVFKDPDHYFREFGPLLAHLNVEHFLAVFLNGKNQILSWKRISSGGRTATIVEPAEIYRLALQERARYVVLLHNHPEHTLAASRPDILLTEKIRHGLDTLGVGLQDHIIICGDNYLSFRKAGFVPPPDPDRNDE
jgi:DNA repair protein RadC